MAITPQKMYVWYSRNGQNDQVGDQVHQWGGGQGEGSLFSHDNFG